MSITILRPDSRYGDNFDQSQGLLLRFDNWVRPGKYRTMIFSWPQWMEGEKQIPLTHMPPPLPPLLLPLPGAEMQKLAEKSSRANV